MLICKYGYVTADIQLISGVIVAVVQALHHKFLNISSSFISNRAQKKDWWSRLLHQSRLITDKSSLRLLVHPESPEWILLGY